MQKRLVRLAALAAAAVTIIGCNKNTNNQTVIMNPLEPGSVSVAVHSVSVSPAFVTIERDPSKGCVASIQLSVSVAGTGDYNRTVVWSASEGTVDANGVFSIGKSGSFIIKATSVQQGNVVGTAVVTVVNSKCGGDGGNTNPPQNPNPPKDPDPPTNPPTNPPPPPCEGAACNPDPCSMSPHHPDCKPEPPATKPTVQLSVNPGSIEKGQSATLTHSASNDPNHPTSCAWTSGLSGTAGLSGSRSVSPSVTTAYAMACTNSAGTTTRSVTVTVTTPEQPPPAAPNFTFTANPSTIEKGQGAALVWNQVGGPADSCSGSGAWSGTKGVSGSESVYPTSTATYTLACTGEGGTTTKSVTITVTTPEPPPPPPPPPGIKTIDIVDTPASGKVGEERQLTAVCKIDGKVVTSCSPWWRSSDSSRVSVDPGTGLLKFVGLGPARITVQWSPFETKPDDWFDIVAVAP